MNAYTRLRGNLGVVRVNSQARLERCEQSRLERCEQSRLERCEQSRLERGELQAIIYRYFINCVAARVSITTATCRYYDCHVSVSCGRGITL